MARTTAKGRREHGEFYERLRALVTKFRTRANELRDIEQGTPGSWRHVRPTYAFRDRPLPAATPPSPGAV
ncbi:MAG TPA: hypothetical protein VF230_08210 [Acidimicrobiales bacterium]